MRVRMLTGMAGLAMSLAPGDVHECDEAEAIRLIEAGYAVPEAEAKPAETTDRKVRGKETR